GGGHRAGAPSPGVLGNPETPPRLSISTQPVRPSSGKRGRRVPRASQPRAGSGRARARWADLTAHRTGARALPADRQRPRVDRRRTFMGARGETLARQLEAKAREAVAVLERLSDEEWKKVTRAERWTVGVTAHHLATAFGAVPDVVAAIASGQLRGNFTRSTLDEMNARHAKEHAGSDKAETIALFKKGAATAATKVRGLSDDQLPKSGT